METKCCAILGAAASCFPWGYDEEDERCGALKIVLLNMANYWRAEGITAFAVTLDAGVGLYAAELIGGLREEAPELSLTCFVPWEEQATKWPPELRERYFSVLAACSEVETVTATWTASCEVEAKLQAIDSAERVFAVTAKEEDNLLALALHYARRVNKAVLIFDSDKTTFRN